MTSKPSYVDHNVEQLRRWRATTAAERLRWLEQAKEFAALAKAAAEQRKRRGDRPKQS